MRRFTFTHTDHQSIFALLHFVLTARSLDPEQGVNRLDLVRVLDDNFTCTDGHRLHTAYIDVKIGSGFFKVDHMSERQITISLEAETLDWPDVELFMSGMVKKGRKKIKIHVSDNFHDYDAYVNYTSIVRAMDERVTLNFDFVGAASVQTEEAWVSMIEEPVLFIGKDTKAVVMPMRMKDSI